MGVGIGPNIENFGDVVFCVDAADEISYRDRYRTQTGYDYGLWFEGDTGNSIGGFSDYANVDQNRRVWASDDGITDPWGNDCIVWRCYSGDTYDETYPSQGGIYCNSVSIDNTKMYRVAYWDRRNNGDNETYARHYIGLNGYGSVNGVKRLTNETVNTNPYFNINYYNEAPANQNIWYLTVGHIYPYDTTYTSNQHPDSGTYTVSGGRIDDTFVYGDYRWIAETTTGRPRALNVYRGYDSGTTHWIMMPRFDICDGTEPSIEDLVSGRTDYWWDMNNFTHDGYSINGAEFFSGLTGGDAYLQFEDNDYVNCGDISSANFSNLTVEMWFNWDGTVVNNYAGLWYKTNSSDIGRMLINSGGLFLEQNGNGNFFSVSSITSDTWYHVIYTYNQSAGYEYIYCNGEQYGSLSRSGDISQNSTDLYIGYGSANDENYAFSGKIATMKVYNVAFSEADIIKRYKESRTRFYPINDVAP